MHTDIHSQTHADIHAEITRLKSHIEQYIIGQSALVNHLLIALLADGHLLVEGAPGLAKTRIIKVLAEGIEGDFHRIQFTPDLLPADLTGTDIYRQPQGDFVFQPGPLFHNLVLADEINRAPAKVQSALLEAMAERQITVGAQTYPLPKLFLVMATQNPIEQEGTYPLPEAQLDRFLMKVQIDYPNENEELGILRLARNEARDDARYDAKDDAKVGAVSVTNPDRYPKNPPQNPAQNPPQNPIQQAAIFAARDAVLSIHMSDNIEQYLLNIVLATRRAGVYNEAFEKWLQYGASPRATITLDRCARAHAWLQQRDYVGPEDVQAVAHEVLRHRLILNYEAEAEGMTTDKVITALLEHVAVP